MNISEIRIVNKKFLRVSPRSSFFFAINIVFGSLGYKHSLPEVELASLYPEGYGSPYYFPL
jgi:hypothetical protein